MADLIDRAAALDFKVSHGIHEDCEFYVPYGEVKQYLEQLPSAERKGHWQITDAYPHNVYCSECHKRFAQTHWAVWEDGSLPRTYCPNCGARMDGEQ